MATSSSLRRLLSSTTCIHPKLASRKVTARSSNHLQYYAAYYRNDHDSTRIHTRIIAVQLCAIFCASIGLMAGTSSCTGNDDIRSTELSDVFMHELRTLLPPDQIDEDDHERRQRGKPWSSYHPLTNYPRVIVSPSSTEQVSSVVRLCSTHQVPLVAFGGGTSLEGQTLTPQGGVSLDFSNMRGVLELNQDDLDVRVQAGMGYVELNELLRPLKLWFPLDPGPGATVGGMCACRCSGSTAVKYGSMRENVLNLTAVLADGTIVHTAGSSRARKSSAGYDLTRLLVGSEGTLAVITEATLKLHTIPKHAYALRVSFPSVREAAAAARDTLHSGVSVGRCELLDDVMVKIVNETNQGLDWEEQTTLLIELTGHSHEGVMEQLQVVQGVSTLHGGGNMTCVTDEGECRSLWSIRKQCLWSAMSRYPDREAMITDACVPLSRLPDLIAHTRQDLDRSTLPAPVIAHAGDGNFHVLLMLDPTNPADLREARRLAHIIATRAIAMGGTCTGEHGVGVGKRDLLRTEMGPGAMRLMEIIKRAIDPRNVLNPGKVLEVDQEKEKEKEQEHER